MGETCSLEIRVLGPFELLVGGRALPVRAAGERALLARLASSQGQVVTTDRLIDDLWQDELPADPRNALQLRVSELRKLVGAALVTESAGYRLDVGENDVDASRFRRMVSERRYEDALSLWRGAPYGEFAAQGWARVEAGQLAELRASAVEERMAARLDTGEGASLVPELVALVAEDPLRERLRGQLMRALYRSGRTAEALAKYRELRLLLRDELGLTPSVAAPKGNVFRGTSPSGSDGPASRSRSRDSTVLAGALNPVVIDRERDEGVKRSPMCGWCTRLLDGAPRTCTDFAELSDRLEPSTPPQVLGISLQSTSECGVAA